MTINVRVVGSAPGSPSDDPGNSFVFRAVQLALEDDVNLVSGNPSHITLVYPYSRLFRSAVAGTIGTTSLRRLSYSTLEIDYENWLRRLHGIPRQQSVLVVSHENLDRSPWTAFGEVLRSTDLPRLTHWPQSIDPRGFRVPYWWNYLDWPEIPRPHGASESRFGKWYEPHTLLSPLAFDEHGRGRLNKAVWVTNHLSYPRSSIRDRLESQVEIDVVNNIPWGQKASYLERYRYCVVTENSVGYGYETEKVPEAWMAGCIPIGYVANPMGDFNPKSFFFDLPVLEGSELPPLIDAMPSLSGLLDYLSINLADRWI